MPAPEPTTEPRSKTKHKARKRGGRSKAKAEPQEGEGEPWPTCWVLNLTMLFRLSKPMPAFGTDKMHALFKVIRRRALRLAGFQAARPPHPLNIIGPALVAETKAHGKGERKEDEPYGTTPLLRFLGDYLKKVEAAGMVLVPCNADKYSAFAACVNFRPPSFTETDTLLANMRAAGIVSAADAEGSVRPESSDDDNTLVAAPRRRLTRAEYDAGHGNSSEFSGSDDASDDEAQITSPAGCALPSMVGSAVSG